MFLLALHDAVAANIDAAKREEGWFSYNDEEQTFQLVLHFSITIDCPSPANRRLGKFRTSFWLDPRLPLADEISRICEEVAAVEQGCKVPPVLDGCKT